jgi:hypothetical protein
MNCGKAQQDDAETEKETGVSRQMHEDRNKLNELPAGKLKVTEDKTLWKDDNGRLWKLNPDYAAAYHQPMPLAVAFIRGITSAALFGIGKVPNLKFISPNKDKTYSEIVANRYTGELVIDQQLMGTYNYAKDAPDAMEIGNLSSRGEHNTFDIIPHTAYGGTYKHIAKDIPVGSLAKGPVVLHID